MSSTVCMKLRAKMVARIFIEPPADLAMVYAALTWDVAPSNASGSMLGEPLIGGYARVAIPLGPTHWVASDFGEALNTQNVAFPQASADWGLLQGWALVDAQAVGTGAALVTGSLQTPYFCHIGNILTLGPSGISVGIYD